MRAPLSRFGVSAAIAGAALVAADPAIAHAPIKGIGAFYNGILHPLIVPAHLLLITAIGLLLGQHAPALSRDGWIAFIAAAWLALIIGMNSQWRVPEAVPLVLTLAIAAMLIWARPPAVLLLVALTAAAGTAIGFDSRPDFAGPESTTVAVIGTALGVAILVSYAGGISTLFVSGWKRIAVRVAGSWAASITAVILSLKAANG